ncbi:MAG: FMN-binding protein [Peptostreptococcaceae bacterium]|nr:FMN-binding protein [Peptostreptococcaceae bacterium]
MKYGKTKKFAAVLMAAALCMGGCAEKSEQIPAAEEAKTPESAVSEESEEKEEESAEEKSAEENKEEEKTEKTSEEKASAPKEEVQGEPVAAEPKKEEEKKQEAQVSEKKEEAPAPAPAAPSSKYKDGSYTGSGAGYNGDVTVSLTIQSDKITAVNVTSHADDDIYMEDAKAVISKILSAQSADVDSVSGATYSSEGIKNAVRAALQQAKN